MRPLLFRRSAPWRLVCRAVRIAHLALSPLGTPIHAAWTPHDFVAPAAPDEAANLAARPADTVIETLLAAAHIGLALLDRDMNYRLWNNCLEELFDVPADALLGRLSIWPTGSISCPSCLQS